MPDLGGTVKIYREISIAKIHACELKTDKLGS